MVRIERIFSLHSTSRYLKPNFCSFFIDKGKTLVAEEDGLTYILTALKTGISLGGTDGAAGLRNVAAGFLLNFLINQTALQKKVVDSHSGLRMG